MKTSIRSLLIPLALALSPGTAAGNLIAHWNFDSLSNGLAIDGHAGNVALLMGGAALSEPGSGRTGGATDRAMSLGVAQQRLHVPDASFLNATGDTNAVTLAFWQKLNTVRNQTTLFANSETVPRAFSAHTPWSNNIMYWDTSGCCDEFSQRVTVDPGATWVDVWVHVAMVKSGDLKIIYVDGVEVLNGSSSAPLPIDFTDLVIGNASNLNEAVDGLLDDVAIFSRELTAAEVISLSEGASPTSLAPPNDTDGDGLPDAWERRFAPDLTVLSNTGDADTDGLPDTAEFVRGTKPTIKDSDGDGLSDGVETATGIWVGSGDTGTQPLVVDSDGDGLADGVENPTLPFLDASQPGTNPNLADTDGDAFDDGLEVFFSTSNPRNAASRPLRNGVLDILALWTFDDDADPAIARDTIKGFTGDIENGAIYTADGGGRTSQPGDKAMDFGFAPTSDTAVRVAVGEFLNIAAAQDEIAFSFWQQINAVNVSSSFWAESAVSAGRGAQGHATWSDGNFYWDTGGCCDPPNRVVVSAGINLADPPDWHHLVFQKRGPTKEIWLNGTLVTSGTNAAPLPRDFTVLHIGSDAGTANITGIIDDFAVYADALSPAEIAALAGGASPTSIVPPSLDTDGDGMDNAYEIANGLNPNLDDSLGDLDNDGATNFAEYLQGTKPNNPDTDGDVLLDGVETNTGIWVSVSNRGTHPLRTDSDGDGLPDGVENPTLPFIGANQSGTDPNKLDTDGDGFGDGLEIEFGSNPVLAASTPLQPNQLDLLAYWSFDDASDPAKTVDDHQDIEAEISGEVVFTEAGGGRTGSGADRALDFGAFKGSQSVMVPAARWLNLATAQDQAAISFWQNINEVTSSTVFKFTSPSSSGGERGMSAHATWGDGNFYFDSAGCCDGTQRISGPNDVNLVQEWHHIVFQKNGAQKEIWVDGELKISGSNIAPLPQDMTVLHIGSTNGEDSMLGLLDDFAIFADALTPEQIGRLAAGESPLALVSGAPPSGLAFTAINYNAATSQITLTWSSQPGAAYTLETSQTLASWPVEINDNIVSGGATTTFVHTITSFPGGAPAALYYRVKQN